MSTELRIWVAVLGLTVGAGCERGATPAVLRPSKDPDNHPIASSMPPAEPPTQIRFRDRTSVSGIQFTYSNDEEHSDFSILESLGGGAAVLDFDGDGQLDVFLPGGGTFGDRQTEGRPCSLYRNLMDWHFSDVSTPAGIGPAAHYNHGVAVADCDEDGFDDVVVTGYGGLTLYHNQGDGSFREVADAAGLTDRLWSSSAAWGDFNGDGCLDLYVAHYVDWSFDKNPPCEGIPGHPRDVCPPRQFEGLPDVVYFGNGDGTFRDATKDAGLQPDGKGLGVVVADLDFDGDLDLYVTNDTVPNFLYQNDGHGRFEDISLLSGTAYSDRGTPDGSMGTDVGDFNGDGLPDLWVANYEHENSALYRGMGRVMFRHVSQSAGISAVGAMYVGWGTRFFDADLDGDEDLIVSNGHVIRFPQNSPRRQQPVLLENLDGIRFVNVASRAGDYLATPHPGRGLATGDLDGDGDEDVVVSNLNEPVAVLSNESTSQNHWLAVRVIGRGSCRSSIGTQVVAKVAGKKQTRQVRGGSSYASASDPKLHFGCGTATEVDELTVTWIGGRTLTLRDLACNQIVTVIEPASPAPN